MNNHRTTSAYYSIAEERLDDILSGLPEYTREQIVDVLLADWPEGDEHQEWLDSAPLAEIADWVGSTGMQILQDHRENEGTSK